MINEAYCSFEVAKLLKDKGFLQDVNIRMTQNLSYYDNIGLCHNLSKYYDSLIQDKIDFVIAPTHQMACAWLREVHKVLIVIDAYHADHWEGCIDSFEIRIYSHASTIIVPNEIAHHTDYTEAVEAAIKYSLENLL